MSTTDTVNKAHALAMLVAMALGNGWQSGNTPGTEVGNYGNGTRATVKGPGGAELGLYLDEVKGKLNIVGRMPKREGGRFYGLSYAQSQPNINVSADKSPEAIARDITRRLLPLYQSLLAGARQEQAAEMSFDQRTAANANRLAQFLGHERAGTDRHFKEATFSLPYKRDSLWGEGNVAGDKVELNLRNLTPDQAEAVLRALGFGQ